MAVHLPKGTRDHLPQTMAARLAVIDVVRQVFARHGFAPLDTPAFERIDTLFGKYGEEGQKLVFKILKRGAGAERGECDLALRYDLTVPLARVVAMNPQLRLPFKRYHIAPVWRAERPARGRFREFLQCDVDVVGSSSPLAEAECLSVAASALEALGLAKFTIRLNDRRILAAIAEDLGVAEREGEFLVTIDKLDKIGRVGVEKELVSRGMFDDVPAGLWETLEAQADDEATLTHLESRLPACAEAVAHLRQVIQLAGRLGVRAESLSVDPTLARGLDYYTGPVFEIAVDEPNVGSISGGGRYDGLVGRFSGRDVPAVGVALGLERIFVVLEELGLLPTSEAGPQVFITVFDAEFRAASLDAARAMRDAGLRVDLYLGEKKLKQQFKLANARGTPWVCVIGPDEAAAGTVALKDMVQGGQSVVSVADAIRRVRGEQLA